MNSGDLHAVVADTVFDGTNRHERAGVLIEGSRVSRILPPAPVQTTMLKLANAGSCLG